jgi:hypothetical protein
MSRKFPICQSPASNYQKSLTKKVTENNGLNAISCSVGNCCQEIGISGERKTTPKSSRPDFALADSEELCHLGCGPLPAAPEDLIHPTGTTGLRVRPEVRSPGRVEAGLRVRACAYCALYAWNPSKNQETVTRWSTAIMCRRRRCGAVRVRPCHCPRPFRPRRL